MRLIDGEGQQLGVVPTFEAKKLSEEAGLDLVEVSPEDKPNIIFDLLGGSPTDLLLPSNILIVEGFSDAIFL